MNTNAAADMNVATLRKERSSKDGVNWVTAIFMALFHIGAIAALFFFTWKALFVAVFCGGSLEALASA